MSKALYDTVESILGPIYNTCQHPTDRPFITLTFAQSLDGKIAKQGQQVLLSGKESLVMTHRLRTLHDGIMVGVGTALVDNPQLNIRFLSPEVTVQLPQPIVLDPYLKLLPDCKLIQNYATHTGKQPWLIVSGKGYQENQAKQEMLETAGVKIIVIDTDQDHIPLDLVFKRLKKEGIHTLMIEGGAKIIQSCLKTNFDQLILTIAPVFIGSEGVPATTDDATRLENVNYTTLGRDVVMTATKE